MTPVAKGNSASPAHHPSQSLEWWERGKDSRRLAIAIDDAEVRFAWIGPSGSVQHEVLWLLDRFSTLIEAMLRFETESGQPLWQATAAIAIYGATYGESISLHRGRWTISRAGLASILGTPPTIINHVVAKGWASVGDTGAARRSRATAESRILSRVTVG